MNVAKAGWRRKLRTWTAPSVRVVAPTSVHVCREEVDCRSEVGSLSALPCHLIITTALWTPAASFGCDVGVTKGGRTRADATFAPPAATAHPLGLGITFTVC